MCSSVAPKFIRQKRLSPLSGYKIYDLPIGTHVINGRVCMAIAENSWCDNDIWKKRKNWIHYRQFSLGATQMIHSVVYRATCPSGYSITCPIIQTFKGHPRKSLSMYNASFTCTSLQYVELIIGYFPLAFCVLLRVL